MRYFILSSLVFLFAYHSFAQKSAYTGIPSLIWPKLYAIKYEVTYDNTGKIEKPIFSQEIKNLNNKSITLPGYLVPFENGLRSTHVMLSSLPLNACFFCGVGGPETVVEVFLNKEIRYTEKPVEIKGVLKLNDNDPEHLIYLLENSTLLGEIE